MSGNGFTFGASKPTEEAKPASTGFSFGGSKPTEEAKPASTGFSFGGSKPAEEAKPAFGGSKPTSTGFFFGANIPTEEAKPASSEEEEDCEELEEWEDVSGENSGDESDEELEGRDDTPPTTVSDEEEEWEEGDAYNESGEEEESEEEAQSHVPPSARWPKFAPIMAEEEEDEDSSCVEIVDISDDDDVAVVTPQKTTTTTSSFSVPTSQQPIISTQRQAAASFAPPQTQQYQPTTFATATSAMPAPTSRVAVQRAEAASETEPMALVAAWMPQSEMTEGTLSSILLKTVSRIDTLVANMRSSVDYNNKLGTPPGTPKMLGDSRRSAVDEAEEAIADMTACGALSPMSPFAGAPRPSFSPMAVKSEPVPRQHFCTEFPESSVTSLYLKGITTLSNQLLALQKDIANSTAHTSSTSANDAVSSAATAAVGTTVFQGKSVKEWKDRAESFEAEVLRSREILKSEAVPSVSVIHRELIEKRSHVRELLAREVAFGNDLARLESDLFKSKIDSVSKMEEFKDAMSRFHIAEAQICALTSQVSAYLQDVRRRSLMQSAELTEWRKSASASGSHGSSTILHITDQHINVATSEGGEGTDVTNTAILSALQSLRSSLSGAQSGLQGIADRMSDDVACLKMFSKAMGDGEAAAASTSFTVASPLAARPTTPSQKTPARPASFARISQQQQPLPVTSDVAITSTGNITSKLMQTLQAKVMALEKENAELKKDRALRDVVAADPSPTKGAAQPSSQPNSPRLRIQTPGSTLTALDLPSTGMFDSRVDVAALGVAWSSGARVLFPLLRAAAESLGWSASLEGSGGINDTPLFGASRSRTNATGSIDTPSVVFTLLNSPGSSSTRLIQVSVVVSQFAGDVKDSNFVVERDIGGSAASKVGDTMTGSELFAALVEGSSIEREKAKKAAMPAPQPQPCPAPMTVSPFAKSAFATSSTTTTTTTTKVAPTLTITSNDSGAVDDMNDDAPAIIPSSRSAAAPATPLSLQGSQVTTPTSKKAGGGRTFQVMARSKSPEWIRKGIEGEDAEQPTTATTKSSSQQPVILGIKRVREEVDSVISDDAMSKVVETGSSHVGEERRISTSPSIHDTKTDDGENAAQEEPKSSSVTTPEAELETAPAEPATLAHQDDTQKEEDEALTTSAPVVTDQAAEEDEEAADEEEGDMFDAENPWA